MKNGRFMQKKTGNQGCSTACPLQAGPEAGYRKNKKNRSFQGAACSVREEIILPEGRS